MLFSAGTVLSLIFWLAMPYSESLDCVMSEILCWTPTLDRWIDVNVLYCRRPIRIFLIQVVPRPTFHDCKMWAPRRLQLPLLKFTFSIREFAFGNVCIIFIVYVLFSPGGYSLNMRKTLRDSRFKASASGDHVLPVIFPEYSVGGSRRIRGGHSVSPIDLMFTLRNLTTVRAPAWVRSIGTRYKSECYSIYAIETRWLMYFHSSKSMYRKPSTLDWTTLSGLRPQLCGLRHPIFRHEGFWIYVRRLEMVLSLSWRSIMQLRWGTEFNLPNI